MQKKHFQQDLKIDKNNDFFRSIWLFVELVCKLNRKAAKYN